MLPSTSRLNTDNTSQRDEQDAKSSSQTAKENEFGKPASSQDLANVPSTSQPYMQGGETNEIILSNSSPPTKRKVRVASLESQSYNFVPRLCHRSNAGERSTLVSTVQHTLDTFDIIEESSNISTESLNMLHLNPLLLDYDEIPISQQIEPIVIRGNGNLTIFGLSNSFIKEFPQSLIGRVSREEFEHTMDSVNSLLRQQQSMNAKIILVGCLCCCCSFGCSLLWPSVALRKRTKASLEKLLANENNRLYRKLGLEWKLSKQRCYSNHAFLEYALLIEFIAKVNLYQPD